MTAAPRYRTFTNAEEETKVQRDATGDGGGRRVTASVARVRQQGRAGEGGEELRLAAARRFFERAMGLQAKGDPRSLQAGGRAVSRGMQIF